MPARANDGPTVAGTAPKSGVRPLSRWGGTASGLMGLHVPKTSQLVGPQRRVSRLRQLALSQLCGPRDEKSSVSLGWGPASAQIRSRRCNLALQPHRKGQGARATALSHSAASRRGRCGRLRAPRSNFSWEMRFLLLLPAAQRAGDSVPARVGPPATGPIYEGEVCQTIAPGWETVSASRCQRG